MAVVHEKETLADIEDSVSTLPLLHRWTDTSDHARLTLTAHWRDVPGAEKLEMALQMTEETIELAKVGIRLRHPHFTDEEVRHAWLRMWWGDETYCDVFPSRQLPAR